MLGQIFQFVIGTPASIEWVKYPSPPFSPIFFRPDFLPLFPPNQANLPEPLPNCCHRTATTLLHSTLGGNWEIDWRIWIYRGGHSQFSLQGSQSQMAVIRIQTRMKGPTLFCCATWELYLKKKNSFSVLSDFGPNYIYPFSCHLC